MYRQMWLQLSDNADSHTMYRQMWLQLPDNVVADSHTTHACMISGKDVYDFKPPTNPNQHNGREGRKQGAKIRREKAQNKGVK